MWVSEFWTDKLYFLAAPPDNQPLVTTQRDSNSSSWNPATCSGSFVHPSYIQVVTFYQITTLCVAFSWKGYFERFYFKYIFFLKFALTLKRKRDRTVLYIVLLIKERRQTVLFFLVWNFEGDCLIQIHEDVWNVGPLNSWVIVTPYVSGFRFPTTSLDALCIDWPANTKWKPLWW